MSDKSKTDKPDTINETDLDQIDAGGLSSTLNKISMTTFNQPLNSAFNQDLAFNSDISGFNDGLSGFNQDLSKFNQETSA